MLTEDEKQFIEYWEKNADKEKKTLRQILLSAPLGLVFALPILLLVIFHGWYKNMVYISDSQLIIILITVIGIAVFFAIIRGKFKWENNEQLYKELKSKQKKENLP
jgi:pilus assembly protein TadC